MSGQMISAAIVCGALVASFVASLPVSDHTNLVEGSKSTRNISDLQYAYKWLKYFGYANQTSEVRF